MAKENQNMPSNKISADNTDVSTVDKKENKQSTKNEVKNEPTQDTLQFKKSKNRALEDKNTKIKEIKNNLTLSQSLSSANSTSVNSGLSV